MLEELYIIRHGLAGRSLEDEKMDAERPLKKKGKAQMKEIAKGLKEKKIYFDMVVSSPFLRSKESAEIVNEFCGQTKEVTVTDLLKPDSSFNDLINFLNKLKKPKKIAIVGHEPFLSGFASYCLTKRKSPLINLKKGGVLMLEVGETITPGHCTLSWLMDPNLILDA